MKEEEIFSFVIELPHVLYFLSGLLVGISLHYLEVWKSKKK